MEKLVDRVEVSELTSLDRHAIARYIKRGLFPAPIKRLDRKQLWSMSQLDTWLKGEEGETKAA